MNSKTLLICAVGFLAALPVLASEITGSLCTGVNCPVEGTVVAAPTASPAAGSYTSAQSVTLDATGETSIRYTTDGSAPACPSTGTTYSSAISVGSSATIKAIACYANSASSTVASFAYTITVSSAATVNVSGGGGGGGTYVAPTAATTTSVATPASTSASTSTSAQNQLSALLAQLQVLQNKAGTQQGAAPSTAAGGGASFSRNLQFNSHGEDVRQLQTFLNSNGFPVAAGGAGSPGHETNLFGNATRAALARYQASIGLPATGYLGPLTRTKIAENIIPSAPISVPAPAPATTPSSPAAAPRTAFNRPLGAGSKGADVTALQNILKNEGLLNVSATGYFGALTESAVKAFQEKYNIAKPGDSGYGFVGPKTRAKLNGLL
ncbi:MAG: peptidoglycan-binding protein [bacterium]|nr:peptidoglycan-binding protein [bacterium]